MAILDKSIDDHLSTMKYRGPIFLVSSNYGFRSLYNLAREHSDASIITVDYKSEKPFEAVEKDMKRPMKFFFGDQRDVATGHDGVAELFEAVESNQYQFLFVQNAEHMDVRQCFQLGSLMHKMTHRGELCTTRMFVKFSDWFYRPEFHKEHLPDGSRAGSLGYACRSEFFPFMQSSSAFLQKFDAAFAEVSMAQRAYADFWVNVHGPHLSGKSLTLNRLEEKNVLANVIDSLLARKISRPFVTVTDDLSGSQGVYSFMKKVAFRDLSEDDTLLIDDAHKLHPSALDQIRSRYPLGVCASLKPLPNFDAYIDCADLN